MKKIFYLISTILFCIQLNGQSIDSLLIQGNYQKALSTLENDSQKSLEKFDKIASIYQSISNYTKAIENYKKALEIADVPIIQTKLANVYNLAGLPRKAISLYEAIVKQDSTNLLAANSLGKLYLSNSKVNEAKEIFRYLKKKDTLNPNYPYQLAIALGRQKQLFEMGDNYLEAYKRDTLHIKSIYRIAKFFKDLKFRDSTMLFIDKGLKIDKNNVNFNQMKANALYTSKDYQGSIKHLCRLDSLGYESVNTYEMFGMSYLNIDKDSLAEVYFKKALDIEPRNTTILYRLASLNYKKKDIKRAKRNLMWSIISAKPDLYKQYFLMGIIQKEDGKLKMAIDNFEKSFQNNSNNHKSLYELAIASDAYYKDKKIAYRLYEKYIDRFEQRDKDNTAFVLSRMKEIKQDYFLEGEIVD